MSFIIITSLRKGVVAASGKFREHAAAFGRDGEEANHEGRQGGNGVVFHGITGSLI
jgi:hypothetical protein